MSAPEDGLSLAVGLLHEAQHSILNATQYLFDLHQAPATLGYSPWRDDPRPASGILHGAYAYLAVARFWRTEARHSGDPLAAFEFARWRAAVAGAADTLLAGGRLTAAGTRFVTALRERVEPWLAEPVPADIDRLAAGANADHRLRWRLRNLSVPVPAARALAEAWRAGRPPPAPLPPASVRPGGGRALEQNARLDLVHRVVRDGSAPGSAAGAAAGSAPGAAADLAYARGDLSEAASGYRRAIRADPADDGAWAGLGLTAGEPLLARQPELVAAIHRAVAAAGPAPEPDAVAAWLAPLG